jgi:2-polyprenyl-3-methyl-5-hydroxy-6-metoxy-1,4-benzoquinol methylase
MTIDDRAAGAMTDERAFYDDMWEKFGSLDDASPAAFHRRRIIAELARRAAPAGAARVLDVGCGQGDLLRELAAHLPGARMFGADISEASLAETRRKNAGLELFALDLTAPAFLEQNADRLGRFDLVVLSEVLEHLEDEATSLRNLSALVADGGAVIVTVPGGEMSRFDVAIGHKRHYRPRRLAAALEAAGLRVERVFAWGFPFHNLYRTAVRVASRASMPAPGSAPPAKKPGVSSLLAGAYVVFGRALKPLFYLNLDRGGEQLFAVARKGRA